MEEKYIQNAKIIKALSDPKRLRIVDIFSFSFTIYNPC